MLFPNSMRCLGFIIEINILIYRPCESNMEFYDNITKQNYYELYNSMFVVLLAEKSDYSPENNQNLVVTLHKTLLLLEPLKNNKFY